MSYEVTIIDTYEEEVEDDASQQEPAEAGVPEGENPAEGNTSAGGTESGSGGGKKTVIRQVERTEERTITRDLVFMPEN